MNRFLIFMSTVIVAIVGVGLMLMFQSMIPANPGFRQELITASVVAFFGLSCFAPLMITIGHSYSVHGSFRPALRAIGTVLLIGIIWSALTNPDESTDHD